MHKFELVKCGNEKSRNQMHEIREKVLFPDGKYNRNHADDNNLDNHCFVFMIDDKAVGTVRLDFIEKQVAAVRLVAVLPEHQDKKIGTMMLAAVENYAKQHGVYKLVTNAEINAEGFYKTLGYVNEKWVDPGEGISRQTTPMTKKSNSINVLKIVLSIREFLMNTKIIFIPGNGGGSPKDNWFPSVKKELEAAGLTVLAEEFPDNDLARASYWIPFILDELKVDENTVLVGHSSGAIAAMRIAEKHRIFGSVLVGAYHTHLDIEKEKQSGYFDTAWDWEKIKNNQQWTILFAAKDDPWVPVEQPRHIHLQLNCEYHEYNDQGHFGGDYVKSAFPELSQAIIRNIKIFTQGCGAKARLTLG